MYAEPSGTRGGAAGAGAKVTLARARALARLNCGTAPCDSGRDACSTPSVWSRSDGGTLFTATLKPRRRGES
jgi:hypothetical protein